MESLEELLKVAFIFNRDTTINFFPERGALAYGELVYMDFRTQNEKNGVYNVSSPIGKAMVFAHDKAESQQWSGTVIDSSLIEEIENRGLNVHDMLDPYAIKYNVPYKVNKFQVEEYALRLTRKEDDINPNMLENLKDRIKGNFARHNKDVSHHDVQLKIANTIKFLEDTL